MPIDIHGKQYVLVNERIQEFNQKYPNGSITTEVVFVEEVVRCKATIRPDVAFMDRVFTGHAEELRGSSMINKTSAVENCETSAVGRALAMLGIGVADSIASADEVIGALAKEKLVPEDPFADTAPQTKVKTCPKCGKTHQGKYPKCLDCWKADNAK